MKFRFNIIQLSIHISPVVCFSLARYVLCLRNVRVYAVAQQDTRFASFRFIVMNIGYYWTCFTYVETR